MSILAAARERTAPAGTQPMRIVESFCDYAVAPLGIATARPRFGWHLASERRGSHQSAYRLIVSSSEERLRDGIADRWDSGKVASADSVHVAYAGAPLGSAERCWWRVQVWDERDQTTPWSEPTWFETALLREQDWLAQWIGDARVATQLGAADAYDNDTDLPAPLLRREFRLEREIASARLYIAGIGWHEAFINGQRVGDRVLDALTSDYDQRVLYATHDVTPLLVRGANALGVMLGNGWYCPAYGDSPRLRCQLAVRFVDGGTQVIASDEGWRSDQGPIQRNSITVGEVYDARRERPGWDRPGFDDSAWRAAVVKAAPGGAMTAQQAPPIRVNETLAPRSLRSPAPGVQVFDFGLLFAGWARLRLRGAAGQRVTITYAPLLLPDGRVKPLKRGRAHDVCILSGDPDGECYAPRFTFHPVRFVQVEGSAELTLADAAGMMAYNDVELPRGFACANQRLNRIHACVRQTLTNELYGIQMDCINAEHWGWLEPGSNPGTLYPRAWMPLFWEKFLDDARAAQHADGVIPDVVPAYPTKGRKTGDPSWAGNFPLVVWHVYRACEDRRVLEDSYEAMARWLAHLGTKAVDGIVADGYYGDHMLPGSAPGGEQWMSEETPPPLLRTAFYFADARVLALAAADLGRGDDERRYGELAAAVRRAFNAQWYDASLKRYVGGAQTANLLALALGLVPDGDAAAVAAGVARDIAERHGGHHHTGNVGTTALMETLVAHGHGEAMYALVDRDDYPGWGYMVAQGATTIWESWGGPPAEADSEDDRLSMAMFTTIDHFLWNDLAGIRGPDYFGVARGAAPYAEIVIRPFVPAGLAWAGGAHPTARGEVAARWERTADGIILEATIPVNCTARIHVPTLGRAGATISEGGREVWRDGYVASASGLVSAEEHGDRIVFTVGSGSYRFQVV